MANKIYCQPCLRDEQEKPAAVYCYNCAENMCVDCQSHHKKSKASSNHKLSNNLEGDIDLKGVNILSKISKCTNHTSEDVKYLCKDHDVLCCNECAILTHRKCEDLVSIAEEYKKTGNKTEGQNDSLSVRQTLAEFERFIDACLSHETRNLNRLQDSKLLVEQELEQVKKRFEDAYQTLRKNVLKNVEEISKKLSKSGSNRTDKMNALKKEVTALNLQADAVAAHGTLLQRYLHDKLSRQAISSIQESIQNFQQEIMSYDFEMKENQPVQNVIESISTCCEVHEKYSKPDLPSCEACNIPSNFRKRTITLEHEANLSENFDTPRSCLWIRDYIIVASQSKSKVLLYDTTTNYSLSTYQLTNQPWSMTSIDHQTFAVCVRDLPQIEILKIDNNQIKHKHNVNTKSTVVGLSFDRKTKQLVCLSQRDETIYFLKLDGQRQYTVPVGEDLKSDLKKSYCLALDNRTQIIYVSCCDSGKVLAITKEGEKLAQLTHVESVDLNCPWEVTVDADSNVYICIMHSQYVLQCDKDLNVIRKLLQEQTPLGISFNKNMTKIALSGNFTRGWLKMYRFE